MIAILDAIHSERQGEFERLEDAFAELQRRASIPWNERPNTAPCSSWRTCGREYEIIEYDTSEIPWKPMRHARALKISSAGAEWTNDFQEQWNASAEIGGAD